MDFIEHHSKMESSQNSYIVNNNGEHSENLLSTWIALEALSPQIYRRREDLCGGDKRCIAELKPTLPWEIAERSRPKKELYYQVLLGAIDMKVATESLVKAFGENEELNLRMQEKSSIAAILVNKNGIPLQENSIAISSFAWALPLALQRQLSMLATWPDVERQLIEQIKQVIFRTDEDDNLLPLTASVINKAHTWLVDKFGLSEDFVEAPSFAFRVYHYYAARYPPEVSLLNSFFIEDLSKAKQLLAKQLLPSGLRRYLRSEKPKDRIDVLVDNRSLENALSPLKMPLVRWPVPGGHPLVTLQQAAVNSVRSELSEKQGVLAVNGPPGTGKTTLLRDVVAACVYDRALAMTSFENPADAFVSSGHKLSLGGSAYFQMYKLSPSLKGHEALVVSSNNKAVENVSKELPALKAIGRNFRYFKTISDKLFFQPETEEGDDLTIDMPQIETWGLIAAVLGNARNRFAFTQNFWWDEERGFRTYLRAAKGDSVVREIKDPVTDKIIKREIPVVVQLENPPSPETARANWSKARSKFLALKVDVEKELTVIEEIRIMNRQLAQKLVQIVDQKNQISLEEKKGQEFEAAYLRRKGEWIALQGDLDNVDIILQQHRKLRPGFFARVLGLARWKTWLSDHEPLTQRRLVLFGELQKALDVLNKVQQQSKQHNHSVDFLRVGVSKSESEAHLLRVALRPFLSQYRDKVVDSTYFEKGHESWNLSSPWLPDSLHKKREDLFIAAMEVHKAFIDASAQKILHNISVWVNVSMSGEFPDEDRRKLMPDIWSTLFMVVPVISTTFASVNRMLGSLPPESLGWLLIDEAGQALPQAAVGAIMRSKRCVVVGDPIQIPPVTSLPDQLTEKICKFFQISDIVWAAPEASVQTLADAASRYQSTFQHTDFSRRVGLPLLVHRRCQNPMFQISNSIAYNNKMVFAAGLPSPNIGKILGRSSWINIDGNAITKWCAAEGEVVVKLLRQLADHGVANPDIFIVTPFRIVAQELRSRLEQEKDLFRRFGVNQAKWLFDRVGTIHTVQGREADAVILVLGAPMKSQHGARSWACKTPNILNVAVSRAKESMYVVGSHGAWGGHQYARELYALLQ
ncbi:AAA domain-containing protein [Dyadobacter jiangsuensis]